MPVIGIIGVLWLLLVLGTHYWGNRYKLDSAFIKGVQVLITIIALAVASPQLGAFKTALALLWLLLFLAISTLMRRFRVPKLAMRTIAMTAVILAFVGTDSLNVMLIRTLIMLAVTSIFLLGLNLGFRYLIRRILWIFPVLFAVSVITFSIMHAVPGGPFDAEGETDGIPLTPEVRANLMRKYNLDQPLHIQYISWVSNVIRGDFGYSFQHQSKTCQELIAQAWPVSVHLGSMALIVAISGGLFLGILAAVYQNTWVDYIASLTAVSYTHLRAHET